MHRSICSAQRKARSCAASQISRCAHFSDLVKYLLSNDPCMSRKQSELPRCIFTLKALLEKYCVQCFEAECAKGGAEAVGAQEAKKKY